MDKDRLVFPPVPAAIIASIFYILFTTLFPIGIARALFAGALFGYVLYDLMHYYLHHGAPDVPVMVDMKSYHMAHHYMNHDLGRSEKIITIYFDFVVLIVFLQHISFIISLLITLVGFGISSKAWDFCFGTELDKDTYQ